MIIVALIQTFRQPQELVPDIKYYPDFIEMIEKGEVTEVKLVGNNIEASLADGTKGKLHAGG